MKTKKDELQAIATLLQGNKITTILALHDVGYDFNKTIEEQSEEVVEKVSQMLLDNFTNTVPSDVVEEAVEESHIVEEEVTQPVEEVAKTIDYTKNVTTLASDNTNAGRIITMITNTTTLTARQLSPLKKKLIEMFGEYFNNNKYDTYYTLCDAINDEVVKYIQIGKQVETSSQFKEGINEEYVNYFKNWSEKHKNTSLSKTNQKKVFSDFIKMVQEKIKGQLRAKYRELTNYTANEPSEVKKEHTIYIDRITNVLDKNKNLSENTIEELLKIGHNYIANYINKIDIELKTT